MRHHLDTLERPGRLFVNATGSWNTSEIDDVLSDNDDPTRTRGDCWLQVDGTDVGQQQSMGERVPAAGDPSNHPPFSSGTMAPTGLSGALSAGSHAVDLFCHEIDGLMYWDQVNMTAAVVDDAE